MYLGAISALEQHLKVETDGVDFSEFVSRLRGTAGTSIGALAALSLLLGLSTQDLYPLMIPIYESFRNIAPRPDITSLISNYGLDNGNELRSLVRGVLQLGCISGDITFKDMYRLLKREFVCCASNLHTHEVKYFNAQNTPEVKVVDAVYMSMTIPFVFVPHRYNGELYVDGALTHNIPQCFDPLETLFFTFETSERRIQIENLSDFLQSLCGFSQDALPVDSCHTIRMELPIMLLNEPTINFSTRATGSGFDRRIACGYASALNLIRPNFFKTVEVVIEAVFHCLRNQKTDVDEEYNSFCASELVSDQYIEKGEQTKFQK